ncbi:MAG: hypothetical protein COB12_07085 [Flavobacterium sp.]|nr:MAG: hypothetical protein COB12_07085 [Flavobacterium sp.]
MNRNDTFELINHSKKQIQSISSSLKKGTLNKVEIKNTLENLRSILDYLAVNISSKLKHPKKRVHFPYGRRQNHFKNAVKLNLPNLSTEFPLTYQKLEEIQPYKSKKVWLIDLCELTNEAKHNNLNPVQQDKLSGIDIPGLIKIEDLSKIGNLKITGNTVNGQRIDDIETVNGKIINHSKNQIAILFSETNKFKFSNKEVEITTFLDTCHENLNNLFKSLEIIE